MLIILPSGFLIETDDSFECFLQRLKMWLKTALLRLVSAADINARFSWMNIEGLVGISPAP